MRPSAIARRLRAAKHIATSFGHQYLEQRLEELWVSGEQVPDSIGSSRLARQTLPPRSQHRQSTNLKTPIQPPARRFASAELQTQSESRSRRHKPESERSQRTAPKAAGKLRRGRRKQRQG